MAKLTSKQLQSLPDELFGLPKTRQYPLPDETHIRKAIQFFKFCKEEDRKELANNIVRRAKELQMKIKVQPSSVFYKYAKKHLSRDGEIILEFHIGQLSPIVPIQREQILSKWTFSKEKDTQMDRLRKIWGMDKSVSEKGEKSFDILKEFLLDNNDTLDTNALFAFENFKEIGYMTNSIPSSDKGDVLAIRNLERDQEAINFITQNTTNMNSSEPIINSLNSISDINNFNFALAYIKYTNTINPVIKEEIFNHILNSKFKNDTIKILQSGIDNLNNKDFPYSDGMSEIAYGEIDSFLRLIENKEKLDRTVFKLGSKKLFQKQCGIRESINPEFYFIKLFKDGIIKGYRIIRLNAFKSLLFFENEIGEIYYSILFSLNDYEKVLYSLKIYNPTNSNYNYNIISYIIGSRIEFKLITKEIVIKLNGYGVHILESSDFSDTIQAIATNGKGNISFILGMDRSWHSKLEICKKEMENNISEANEDLTAYKHNLCFLFALINIIERDYANWSPDKIMSTGSEDYKDAIKTEKEAIEYFKKSIKVISKRDTEFSFSKFFITNDYQNKIDIFHNSFYDKKELESCVVNSYNWIMN